MILRPVLFLLLFPSSFYLQCYVPPYLFFYVIVMRRNGEEFYSIFFSFWSHFHVFCFSAIAGDHGNQRVLPYKIAREPNRERWASAGVRLVGLCFDIQDTAENVDFDIFILFRGCVYGVWSIIFRAPLSMTNDDGCIPGLVP